MTKTIKFNLICDNKPLRTIDDWQNNFSIEDMIVYCNNGLLLRWIYVRGYKEEYEQVSKITSTEPIEVIKKLISVFHMESEEQRIAESIYMLEYLNERKKLCATYEKQNYQTKAVIDDYEVGCWQLIDGIIQNPDDIAKIKANIFEIVQNYSVLLKLDHQNLFMSLKEKSQLALMCLIMNEQARKYYLPVTTVEENGTVISDTDTDSDKDKREMYLSLCTLITRNDFKEHLDDVLHSFSGKTEGYWKDPETKDKKFMIISMQEGDYVRPTDKSSGDLGYADIKNRFVILDGIDYKSNNDTHQLLYMEV